MSTAAHFVRPEIRPEGNTTARLAQRDLAFFPGSATRATLARVLVDQLRGGLEREDADSTRRSCALIEAIWSDTPEETRADLLTVARTAPDRAEPVLRAALFSGDVALAATLRVAPMSVLRDLALLPEGVARAICARGDFTRDLLPHILRGRESARVVVARLYPAPLPFEVRDALLSTVTQGDTALADTLSSRRDGFTDNLAADLAMMPPRARIARLRHAVGHAAFRAMPPATPLVETLEARIAARAREGDAASALLAVASLMRVPPADVARLAADDDPVRLALALKSVALDPDLCTAIMKRNWCDHPARAIIEGTMGYAVARMFLGDLLQRADVAQAA